MASATYCRAWHVLCMKSSAGYPSSLVPLLPPPLSLLFLSFSIPLSFHSHNPTSRESINSKNCSFSAIPTDYFRARGFEHKPPLERD